MANKTICCFQSCSSAGECALKWLCAVALCVAAILLCAMVLCVAAILIAVAAVVFLLWIAIQICTRIENKNGPNKVMIRFKFCVYRHAFIILLALLIVSAILAWVCGWKVLVPIIGFGYFLNRQYLAETEMLWDLLKYFNGKYTDNIAEFSRLHKNKNLINYLNFCSEEYLLYTQGYVPPIIWKTWCHGMLEKMACDKKFANATMLPKCCECRLQMHNADCHKLRMQSQRRMGKGGKEYYGLTWEEIEKGAETKIVNNVDICQIVVRFFLLQLQRKRCDPLAGGVAKYNTARK